MVLGNWRIKDKEGLIAIDFNRSNTNLDMDYNLNPLQIYLSLNIDLTNQVSNIPI